MKLADMILEESEVVIRFLAIGLLVIFFSNFDYIERIAMHSKNPLKSAFAKLIIGAFTTFIAFPLIEKVPGDFKMAVIAGICLNSGWILQYFKRRFKIFSKNKMDKLTEKENKEEKEKEEKDE